MTAAKNSPSATMPSPLWSGKDGNAKRRKRRLHRLLATGLAQGMGSQVEILVFGAEARVADLPVPSNHCLWATYPSESLGKPDPDEQNRFPGLKIGRLQNLGRRGRGSENRSFLRTLTGLISGRAMRRLTACSRP